MPLLVTSAACGGRVFFGLLLVFFTFFCKEQIPHISPMSVPVTKYNQSLMITIHI